jgi:hypothetical protein
MKRLLAVAAILAATGLSVASVAQELPPPGPGGETRQVERGGEGKIGMTPPKTEIRQTCDTVADTPGGSRVVEGDVWRIISSRAGAENDAQEDALKKCGESTHLVGTCLEPERCVRKLDPAGAAVEYRLGYKRKYLCTAACER